MMFELLYDLLMGISPMYFYLTMVLSVAFAFRLLHIHVRNTMTRNQEYTKECHAFEWKRLPIYETHETAHDIHGWLTHTIKRLEAPDDDSDYHSFSLLQSKQKRGGQQWNKNLYSLFSENIA
ncbi:hypothetical protein [Gracilibacillus alcaliphilus]|uniref:hypothetical protein n=1 Tax=Gracilibacillus alcaliphilus TaxID=1401441 RepID=UPI0019566056|nr:hypothetical protein [Gracilibacillus alcaliphilus]MBM7677167.1 hypothetical protein [Gracilibacillus alcaliphilus]